MEPLSLAALSNPPPGTDFTRSTRARPRRILQIGDGNFLRGFADWMIDVANGAGLFNGKVTIAQPLPQGIAAKLCAQDHLFTVLLRGVQDGHAYESRRIVSCVERAFDPHSQWAQVLACARDPELRFVISNTTEAGIAYLPEPLCEGVCPESFPAKVAALLHARFQRLGSSSETALVFLPCELIENNGSEFRRAVLRHAQAWGLPYAFSAWIEQKHVFLNTLVDRIVPGFPARETERLFATLGYHDQLLVSAEPFHLWVIEGPEQLARELPLREAGLNVVWTRDLSPYRTRKVRILNGAHTTTALAAYLAGLDTVAAVLANETFARFLARAVFDEIVPFVPLPEDERLGYAHAVLERFANPHIRHELLSIALNSVSKWRVRVLPSLLDYVGARGSLPPALSFSLAALLLFYRGAFGEGGEYRGRRGEDSYAIRDDAEVLELFSRAWQAIDGGADQESTLLALLRNESLFGRDLSAIPGFGERVVLEVQNIQRVGIAQALASVVEEK